MKSEIYQLFPYSSPKFATKSAIQEIKESCNNIKTRISNLEKINKSLGSFVKNENQLKWDELQKINKEIIQLDQISK